MQVSVQVQSNSTRTSRADVDALIIGAGFGGLRALRELRDGLGLTVKVLEAAPDVGGTWFWNQYPGARTDTEAWGYCFFFDKDLLDDFGYRERFPSQTEVLRYLRHVADRFDMRREIDFDTRVTLAVWDESSNRWLVTDERGGQWRATYLVAATGILSVPLEPPFPGLSSFEGEWYLTGRWPQHPVDFTGKRVAVVGTGASGVQVVPVVAQVASDLKVFQRTADYVIPARNHLIDDYQISDIKRNWDSIYELTGEQAWAFPMVDSSQSLADCTTEEEVQRVLEWGWEIGGFRYMFQTFSDLAINEECNRIVADFVRNKIRSIVKDPDTAELLCPKRHPLGSKRPPLGHFYYEAFNRDNVSLVDVGTNPITEITPRGIRLADGSEHELDIIVFAIGYEGAMGLAKVDVRGRDGQTIAGRWAEGPQTYYGLGVDGFPNLFMIEGPHSAAGNVPLIEDRQIRWIARAIRYMREHDVDSMEPTSDAVREFIDYVNGIFAQTILEKPAAEVGSWYYGANIPGKDPAILLYWGGCGNYFKEIQRVADDGFHGFSMRRAVPRQTA